MMTETGYLKEKDLAEGLKGLVRLHFDLFRWECPTCRSVPGASSSEELEHQRRGSLVCVSGAQVAFPLHLQTRVFCFLGGRACLAEAGELWKCQREAKPLLK